MLSNDPGGSQSNLAFTVFANCDDRYHRIIDLSTEIVMLNNRVVIIYPYQLSYLFVIGGWQLYVSELIEYPNRTIGALVIGEFF